MNQAEVDQILENFTVNGFEDIYVLGTKSRGVTIYKQQVRALNLLYSLFEKNKIKKSTKIAVIGGGITGMTTAAAALKLGCHVDLYEKKSVLAHLQLGCKTRWIHPNIYDWPDEKSYFPYASLPILDWQEGYASDVAQEILTGFNEILKSSSIPSNRYKGFFEVKGISIDFSKKDIGYESSIFYDGNGINVGQNQGVHNYDIIILAIGFGLEQNDGSTNSYWRNDDLDQPYLHGEKKSIVISGTGDGACIDLLRSVIVNFHQGKLVNEVKSFFDNCSFEALNKLNTIQNLWLNRDTILNIELNGRWLYNHFEELHELIYVNFNAFFVNKLRKDTTVYLQGKHLDFYDILDLKKISLFNAFMLYMLFCKDAFKYRCVEDETKFDKFFRYRTTNKKIRKVIDKKIISDDLRTYNNIIEYDTLIKRRGPKNHSDFEELSKFIFNDEIDSSKRIWPAGWWSKNEISVNGIGKEFVPKITQIIANTFVETLASNLRALHNNDDTFFRVTLLRFIKINDSEYFQQICRYAGTHTSAKKEEIEKIGRIFEHDFGLVGYSAKLGKPVLLRKVNGFDNSIEKLDTKKAGIREDLQEMLAIPFFVSNKNNQKKIISLLLYVDTSQKEFFNNNVIIIIYDLCKGFINNLENMLIYEEIKISNSEYKGKNVVPNEEVESEIFDLSADNSSLQILQNINNDENIIKNLSFSQIESFNLFT